jgi:hypothetical protein
MVGSRTVWTRATRQVVGRLSSHGVDRIVQRSGKSPQRGCAGNRRRGTAPPTWTYRGQPSAASFDSCAQNSISRKKRPCPEPGAAQGVAEKYASVSRHQFRNLVLGPLIFKNTHSYNPLLGGAWRAASEWRVKSGECGTAVRRELVWPSYSPLVHISRGSLQFIIFKTR